MFVATVAVAEIGVVLMATEAEAEAVDLGVPFGGAVLRSSKLSLAFLKLEEEG